MSNGYWKDLQEKMEHWLDEALPEADVPQKSIFTAMRYSLMDGGKRIRPMLVLEFCRMCGGDAEAAAPFACAVEMIHTYSLIHDDLPCMDNSDLRRGRPSNHKVFGEASALLAGDGLLTAAFETMLSEQSIRRAGADRAARAAGILASAAGAYGMVGGQVLDLAAEGKQVSLEYLEAMDHRKTGALIIASAKMGCAVAGAAPDKLDAAERYASALGLAFQIQDDILDVTSTPEELGKTVGGDAENEKSTYVSLLGLDKAREQVALLTAQAKDALAVFGDQADALRELADSLASRAK